MTGLTYSTYVTQIATMAVVDPNDANFQIILPSAISYAELRINRDLDLLSTVVSSGSAYHLNTGQRLLTIPQGTFVTTQQMNLITPASSTNPETAARNPLTPVTKEYLDVVFGDSTYQAQPQYYAMLTDNQILVGPFPDAAYTVEIVGTVRPPPLSATNTSTFISSYLPDLFIQASMIYVSAYQRNFSSASSNDPQMPITYETQYQTLLKSAEIEEARRKYWSQAWTSLNVTPVASPNRGGA